MSSIQQDLSIFNKFNFEKPPVGVKFLLNKPDGIEKLEITQDDLNLILGGNAVRLFNLKVPHTRLFKEYLR